MKKMKKIKKILFFLSIISYIIFNLSTIALGWEIEYVDMYKCKDSPSFVINDNDEMFIAHFRDQAPIPIIYTKQTIENEWIWESDTLGAQGILNGSLCITADDSAAARVSAALYVNSEWNLYHFRKSLIEEIDTLITYTNDNHITLDNRGWSHVSYCDETPDGRLKYAYRDAENWYTITVDTTAGSGLENTICIDSDNKPHILYSQEGIGLIHTYWGTSSWESDVAFEGTNSHFVLDDNDYPHITYLKNDHIWYRYYDGMQWHDTEIDPTTTEIDSASTITLDGLGNPHIAYTYSEDGGTNYYLKYAYYNAKGWNIEEANTTNEMEGTPQIQINTKGDVHIIYNAQHPLSSNYVLTHSIKYAPNYQEVGGHITSDTNWDTDIRVIDDITIDYGITLTILAGVKVEFQGHYNLNVDGCLLARGTVSDTIIFTINDTTGFTNIDTTAGGWGGIIFNETSSYNDSSMILYSKIEYGKAVGEGSMDEFGGGILLKSFSKLHIDNSNITYNIARDKGAAITLLSSSSPRITNNSITYNIAYEDAAGIFCYNYSNPLIRNNTLSYNSAPNGENGGVLCNNASPTIENNIITYNRAIFGAGFWCKEGANPILTNNIISYNIADSLGGGVYIRTDCNPILTDNIITYNTAAYDGGGIYCINNSHPTLTNNTISDNIAKDGAGISTWFTSNMILIGNTITNNIADSSGGGVYIRSDCNPILTDNIISNNIATYDGGGVYCVNGCNPILTNNTISENTSNDGGGIYIWLNSNMVLTNNIIIDNSSASGAGIFLTNGCQMDIKNNILSGNNSTSTGGAIYCMLSNPTLINNLIYDNTSAVNGGAICAKDTSNIILTNNTIYNNSADSLGGGLYFINYSGGVITNTILWGNIAQTEDSGEQVYIQDDNSNPNFYYCDIQDGFYAFDGAGSGYNYAGAYENNITLLPKFVGSGTHPYTLQASSPCINVGIADTSGLNIPLTDYADNPRVYDGDTDVIDIGAYEYQGNPTTIYVNGHITQNTQWYAGTVRVLGDVTIDDGIKLIINPNTYIEFQGHYALNVQGQLLALGTSSNMITFTIDDTTGFTNIDTTAGGWRGIRFDGTPATNDSSKIIYCKIKYGKAFGEAASDDYGGAIMLKNYSNVLIDNCTITNNIAKESGGGLCFTVGSSPTIKNCTISYNIGYNDCGGIFCNNNSDAIIKNNLITYNSAPNDGEGGGIVCTESNPTIINNIITYNNSVYGGGFWCKDTSDVILRDNIISYNIADSLGGGIYCRNVCNPLIENNTITYNTADKGGGIYLWNECNPKITNNIIENNTAVTDGGGIALYLDCAPSIVSNSISDNNAKDGGGIHFKFNCDPKTANNSIINNIASNYGGAVYCQTYSTPTFMNSILWGNTANGIENQLFLYDDTSDPNFLYSNIQGDDSSFVFADTTIADTIITYEGNYQNNININPKFTDDIENPYTLQNISPCINTGKSDTTDLNLPETDLLGNPRIYDGTIDVIDLGAYEKQEDITTLYAYGTIIEDTRWNADIIKIIDKITINDGVTLTIDPGTYVEFQGHYKFKVLGTLLAIGTEDEMITFTINDTTGFSDTTATGGWHGIRFDSTASYNDSSKIIYCNIEYGKAVGEIGRDKYGGAIYVKSFSNLLIDNCNISNNKASCEGGKGGGIFLTTNSHIIITNCNITNNEAYDGAGLIMSTSNPIISYNTISYNIATDDAGAMQCDTKSNPIITNNIISYNIAANNAGGIFCYDSTNATITDNTITNNSCVDDGGGILCSTFSDPIIRNNIISDNSATSGGGLNFYYESNPLVENNIIENNLAENGAGAYCKLLADPIIKNNIFKGNIAENNGGGIVIKDMSNPTISYNTIESNSASSGAGIYAKYFSTALISYNTIKSNSATNGGGVYADDNSYPILINNLIFENIASSNGGGVCCRDTSNVVLINNTITDNEAVEGGGLFCKQESSPSITNTIIWHNTINQVTIDDDESNPNFYYSNIAGGTIGFDGDGSGHYYFNGDYIECISEIPYFTRAEENPYALQSKSPCIDFGTSDTTGLNLPDTTDFIGNVRIYNDRIDIGAYEYIGDKPITPDIHYDEVIIPLETNLYQNYPNPFNPTTTIRFDLNKAEYIKIQVYNIKGQLVKTLVNKNLEAGIHSIVWEGDSEDNSPVPSGIYYYKMQTEEYEKINRLILLK